MNRSYSTLHWNKILGISKKQYRKKRKTLYISEMNDPYQKTRYLVAENVFRNNPLNIYIETIELFDFLSDSFLNIESFERLFSFALHETWEYIHENNCQGFIIHHKNINNSSIFIDITERKEINYLFHVVSSEENVTDCYFESAHPMEYLGIKSWYTQKSLSLLFGIFLYKNAFPDKFINDAPDEITFDGFMNNKKKYFIIKTDESLIDRSGVTPHFRRGHFRVLRSEVFKKKRYQTIFVHSSFVKGKAKTVLDNSEKEKIMV